MVSLIWNYAMLPVVFDILFDHSPRPSIVGGLSVSTGVMLDPADTKDLEENFQGTLELAAQQSKSFHQVIVERKNVVWGIIKFEQRDWYYLRNIVHIFISFNSLRGKVMPRL